MIKSIMEFRPYFALLKQVRSRFILALLFGVIYGAASGFGFPYMMYKVFPTVFSDDPPGLLALLSVAALLPAVFIVRGISGFGNAYLSAYCGIHVQNQIKADIFDKLQRLPLAFFAKNRVGDIMSRIRADVGFVQKVATVVFNDLIKQSVTFIGAIGYLVYMALQNRQMVFILFALGIIPLCTIPLKKIGQKILHRSQQLQRSAGDINAGLLENLVAVREVRAFNLQKREDHKFKSLLVKLAGYSLKAAKYSSIMTPVIEVVSAVGIAVAVVYTSRAGMGFEEVMPLIAALFMTYDPIKKLGGIQAHVKRGQASMERIEDILHADETIKNPDQPIPFDAGNTDIEFRGVNFSYGQEPVLNNISINIPAGSIAALVGPSGAGKSTFVNLLPRFYEVCEGELLIGGHNIKDYALHELRKNISIVSQETILFRDTIRNNIRVGRLNATDEEVEEAARQSYAHDFIMSFKNGYDTNTGERGLRLSGGQKQRIAIARAFLKHAPILIMDEATSSLDSESEEMVQQALTKLIKGKTVIIIAHRFSTIKMAGKILVFDGGKIRAVGSHDDLYGSDKLYRSLYDRQFVS